MRTGEDFDAGAAEHGSCLGRRDDDGDNDGSGRSDEHEFISTSTASFTVRFGGGQETETTAETNRPSACRRAFRAKPSPASQHHTKCILY